MRILSIELNIMQLTATEGTDYDDMDTDGVDNHIITLTFIPGETEKTHTIKVKPDTLIEDTESLIASLTNPTDATHTLGDLTKTLVNIFDPDEEGRKNSNFCKEAYYQLTRCVN
jgi:hypothetical protein